MAKAKSTVWNLTDVESRRRLMRHIGSLRGLWDVTFKERTKTRSLDQNSFYWIAVVTPFTDWLKESQGDNSITLEDAHEVLKQHILGVWELAGAKLTRSTRKLDTAEFSEYIEKCSAFLAEYCEIAVIDSSLFFEARERGEVIDTRIRKIG